MISSEEKDILIPSQDQTHTIHSSAIHAKEEEMNNLNLEDFSNESDIASESSV